MNNKLFYRFPIETLGNDKIQKLSGMTKKIKTLGNNKDGNDWIASLSLAMTERIRTTSFVIARKNFNFFVAIHLSLIMDCFAFARNDDNNNGLLRSARNDDNGKKKDVYCLIDSCSTALQTKNNDFLFYRFFKFFLFCHTRIL